MSVIALLIVGAAVLPLEPKLLGCKYGESLSDKPVQLLGDWNGPAVRRMLCNPGPGDILAYESFEDVCKRALEQIPDARCIHPPDNYREPATR